MEFHPCSHPTQENTAFPGFILGNETWGLSPTDDNEAWSQSLSPALHSKTSNPTKIGLHPLVKIKKRILWLQRDQAQWSSGMKQNTDKRWIISNPHTQTPIPTTAASSYRTTDLLSPPSPFIPHLTAPSLGRLGNSLEKLSAAKKHPYILTIHHLPENPTHLQPGSPDL